MAEAELGELPCGEARAASPEAQAEPATVSSDAMPHYDIWEFQRTENLSAETIVASHRLSPPGRRASELRIRMTRVLRQF